MKMYKVVTLCGSTRFKEDFLKETERLTLEGHVVLSVGVFGHADCRELSIPMKRMLDELHKEKIRMCDEILVINRNGYIGDSTKSEITYAELLGKNIKYLEETNA